MNDVVSITLRSRRRQSLSARELAVYDVGPSAVFHGRGIEHAEVTMHIQPTHDISILALDLDGTLLTPDYAISDRTLAAIAAFRDSGRGVVIATGRSLRSALPWAERLGSVTALVAHNGGAVYDFSQWPAWRLVSETLLSPDLAKRTIALSRRLDLHFHAFGGDDWYYERKMPGTGIYEQRSGFAGITVDFDAQPELRFNKTMFIAGPGEDIEIAAVAARELCGAEAEVLITSPGFLEILPLGVTKANGLETLLLERGLTLKSAMAIGDAGNDREMILRAGWGIAMGDAPQDVRAGAAFVTLTVAEDGAALAIERFLETAIPFPGERGR